MTVRKLSLGEIVAHGQQLKVDIANRLPDLEQWRARTEQWTVDLRSKLTYDNIKAHGEQLKSDVTSFVENSRTYLRSSLSSARELLSSPASMRDLVATSVSSTVATAGAYARWAVRAYALLLFTLAYVLVVVPTVGAYAVAVNLVLSLVDKVADKADVLRFASEVVLSFLSAFQRTVCWLLAYIRHREKTLACSTRYLSENDVEVYGFVVPRSVNTELLKWLPWVDSLVAPVIDAFLGLLLDVRPDNCGQLDHKNDRYECWVQDGGDKMRVMATRSNCPVAAAASIHRQIQQRRAELSKLALNVTKEA